ncbi:MAG: hypothetical protein GY845_04330 [Planctomycetes bacterium]|nr:hypothetical protein [Planctomycetota bacterium]
MKKKLMIFCIAAGLSLTLAAPSFAAITLDVDPTSLSDGEYLGTVADPVGIIPTQFGNIIFVGEIRNSGDGDLPGKVFDVDDVTAAASLTFDFDPKFEVRSVTFKYGGNRDTITVEAWDNSSTPVLLDALVEAETYGTNPYPIGPPLGAPIGPVTLEAGLGNSIYTLSWVDPDGFALASLNGITLEVIPAPGAILLGSIGVGFVGWLRRRRTL